MRINRPSVLEEVVPLDPAQAVRRAERRRSLGNYLIGGLILGDVLMVWLSMSLGFWLKFKGAFSTLGIPVSDSMAYATYMPQFILATALLLGLQFYTHRYSREGLLASPFQSVQSALFWGMLLGFTSLLLKVDPAISRLFILFSIVSLMALLPLWRHRYKCFVKTCLPSAVQRSVIIVGWNDWVAQLLARACGGEAFFPLRVVALADAPDDVVLPDAVGGMTSEGEELEHYLETKRCDQLIVAGDTVDVAIKGRLQRLCAREMVEYSMIPGSVDALSRCLHIESVQGVPLLTQAKRPLDRPENSLLKRCLDIVGGVFGLLLFAPAIFIFSVLVYLESPGPVFYRQVRTGRNGRLFKIIKIRSMRMDAEAEKGAQWCVEEDPRRLKIGAFMRRMNIDELPQFWNVLIGEMSLVGPRPERPELIQSFKKEIDFYNLRHIVKPGITGWAQVNGWRGDTSLESRIACDLEYIERASLWFDIYIILKTFKSFKNAY